MPGKSATDLGDAGEIECKLSDGKQGLKIDAKLLQNIALHFNNADLQHHLVFTGNLDGIYDAEISAFEDLSTMRVQKFCAISSANFASAALGAVPPSTTLLFDRIQP